MKVSIYWILIIYVFKAKFLHFLTLSAGIPSRKNLTLDLPDKSGSQAAPNLWCQWFSRYSGKHYRVVLVVSNILPLRSDVSHLQQLLTLHQALIKQTKHTEIPQEKKISRHKVRLNTKIQNAAGQHWNLFFLTGLVIESSSSTHHIKCFD